MDGKQLDTIARGMARDIPRRGLLGGMLGGALAIVTGRAAAEARRRDRRRRRSDSGEAESGVEELPIPPGALTGGIWDETMEICHFDPSTGEYSRILVPTTTIPQYLNQGDTLYIDCCVFADCSALPCFAPTSCVEGACAYDPVPGDPCALVDGTTGVCDSEGLCISSYTPAPVSDTEYVPVAPAEDSMVQ
jgi:hypothetical protein